MGAGMLNIKNAPPFEDGVTAKQAEESKRASPGIQGGDFIQAYLGGAKNTRLVGKRLASSVQREIRWLRMNGSASTCCHECNAGFRRTGSRNGQIIAIAVSPPSRSAFRLSTSPSYVRSARTAGTGREEMCRMMQDIKERNARQMWESGSFSSVSLLVTAGHMGCRG
jgi:hypothetical protein